MVGWLAGSLAEVGKLWKRASLKLDATGASTVARAPRPSGLHKNAPATAPVPSSARIFLGQMTEYPFTLGGGTLA